MHPLSPLPIVSMLSTVCLLVVVFFLAGFDVNFMDDVGQTLLNWAAAFGSFEMVSSLHIHSVYRGVSSVCIWELC